MDKVEDQMRDTETALSVERESSETRETGR